MSKSRGNKSSKAAVEARSEAVLEELKQGKSQAAIAQTLGVHRNTICRDLKALTKKLSTANLAEHEARVAAQEAVLELIEQSLIEEQVSPEVANAWRAVRSDIAKLRGLNAENRSVIAHVSSNSDVLFLKFKAAVNGLTDAEIEVAFAYLEKLPRQPIVTIKDASWFPPVEPKQLTEGETEDETD